MNIEFNMEDLGIVKRIVEIKIIRKHDFKYVLGGIYL